MVTRNPGTHEKVAAILLAIMLPISISTFVYFAASPDASMLLIALPILALVVVVGLGAVLRSFRTEDIALEGRSLVINWTSGERVISKRFLLATDCHAVVQRIAGFTTGPRGTNNAVVLECADGSKVNIAYGDSGFNMRGIAIEINRYLREYDEARGSASPTP